MKKSKILLGAMSLTAITPIMSISLTSCGNSNSFTPSINYDKDIITDVTTSKTELNKAFSVTCTCKEGYQVNIYSTTVTVGNKALERDIDYIIYYDTIIVGSAAVVDKNVSINIVADESEKYTVALYANDGHFSDGTKSLFLTDVKKGTKLKDITGYLKPVHDSQSFAYWTDSNGLVDDNTEIKTNMVLGANYKEVVEPTTHNLNEDNWATVAAMCKNMVTFVQAYIDQSWTGTEDEAYTKIIDAIKADAAVVKAKTGTVKLYKTVSITLAEGWSTDVKVRLIDVNRDKAADTSVTKPLFTWEFVSSISIGAFNYNGNAYWIQLDDQQQIVDSCLLRENLNKVILYTLPASIVEAIVPVTKSTKSFQGGSQHFVSSTEILFPLTWGENGLETGKRESSGAVMKVYDDTYSFYKELAGEGTSINKKYYLGYDGTKEYPGAEGYKPTVQYPVWTRSPWSSILQYMYNPDNGKTSEVYTNGGCAVAPAFCL